MVVFVGFLSSWLAKAETTKSYVFVWASSLWEPTADTKAKQTRPKTLSQQSRERMNIEMIASSQGWWRVRKQWHNALDGDGGRDMRSK
jgi:hypothetical protein